MTGDGIPLDIDEFYGRVADDLMDDEARTAIRGKIVQLRDAEKIAGRVKKWLDVPGVKEALQRRPSPAPNDNSKAVGDFTRVLKDQGRLDETGRVKR